VTTVLVASGRDHGRPATRPVSTTTSETPGALRDALESLDPAITVVFRQTDDEAELISWLHEAVDSGWGVVLNPAGFSHYSYALRDAAALVTETGLPLIEVHLTNPSSREDYQRASVVSAVSTGLIAGLGFDSYRFAVRAAADRVLVHSGALSA
jgi:3-dehydroquinate dehydratase-2